MAVAVSVVYNNSYHSPGFDITVTGLDDFNRISILRIDTTGEDRDTPVRGASDVTIDDATFTVTDFEAPIGKSFVYEVTADGVASTSTTKTDPFTRTVSSGWGSTTGFNWTRKIGTAANASVNGSNAVVTITANNDPMTMTLDPVLGDFDFYFDVSCSATATGAQITAAFLCGYQDETNNYRVELRFATDGTIDVLIRRQVAGSLINLIARNDAATYSPGSWHSIRVQRTSGAIRVKVWPQGGSEPADWWAESTADSTFPTGLMGLTAFTGTANTNTKPISVSFDNAKLPGSGGTSLLSETVSSTPTTPIYAPNPGTVWLKSVGQPALSRRVNVVDFDETTRPGRILGEYEVLGRPNKVVLTDVMGGREGSLTLATFQLGGVWESLSTSRELQQLLQLGGTLLMQTAGHATSGEDDMYFEVKDFSRKRIGAIGGELTHLHTIQFIEVDRPATTQESLALRSWNDVLTQNATWGDVLTNHSTWLDVLQRNL